MKKKIFLACAALVVSAAAVVGVKAYSSSTYSLLDANLEAIANGEGLNATYVLCINPHVSNPDRPSYIEPDIKQPINHFLCEVGTTLYGQEPINDGKPNGNVYRCLCPTTGDQWSYYGFCF